MRLLLSCSCLLITLAATQGDAGMLKRSDVVFMYQSGRQTYSDYGATLLAWGGTPTPKSLEEAKGITCFGSVGMVTEFSRYYERFPKTYEQGLCRDVSGNPIKVPWLTDHQHKGIPYWWCCTNQPQFRQYLSERVVETVRAGAAGVHIDDHLGSSGGLWAGTCFCDRCVEGFRARLQGLPAEERAKLGINDLAVLNYRDYVQQWLAQQGARKTNPSDRPLWRHWQIYQTREATKLMHELRELAAKTAGRAVPMCANAGVLWPQHLVDYAELDFFCAEIDHVAHARRFSDLPLFAYRLADGMGRPLAATASGGDWAFVKQHNLSGLVRGWIALSYAAGNYLMAPHHQWCYTPEKGTHWYDGPTECYAPLYQFVRRNASLFDGYESYADVGVVLPHRSFVKKRETWFGVCGKLAAANVSYSLLVGGDELVNHPLPAGDVAATRALLAPEPVDLDPADQKLLDAQRTRVPVFSTVEQALAGTAPAVKVEADGSVRALPRVKPRSAVIHLLNLEYDAERDNVRVIKGAKVSIRLDQLGLRGDVSCRLFAPGAEPVDLKVSNESVTVPELGLWGVLVLEARR